jgi:D-3-phosphoglycerate dehydrogenase
MSPGAALDVFATEPATDSPLFNLPNVVVTPHLGASTTEAQENVALQVAEQMSDYLLTGAVQNALNMPSVTAEEAAVMGPWIKLAAHLGAFVGQMTDEPIKAINVLYDGVVAEMNLKALNAAVIAGMMKATNPDVNMVSAPVIAKERGMQVATTRQDKGGVFDGYIKLTVVTEDARAFDRGHGVQRRQAALHPDPRASMSMPRSASICFTPATATCRA